MSIRSRLQRLTKQAQKQRQANAPHLTVFLVEAGPGRPVGTRADGHALEITFDPSLGPPTLPPGGPHKIVLGPTRCSTPEGDTDFDTITGESYVTYKGLCSTPEGDTRRFLLSVSSGLSSSYSRMKR